MNRFVTGACLLTTVTGLAVSEARAQGTGSSSVAADAGVVRTAVREKPNLDGREPAPADAGDVLIWVPRVLLSPLHLVFEWGVRRPLGALLTVAERDKWADLLVDFFTFEDRKVGLVPTFFFDFNFRPSVGLYLFWNELFVQPHSIRLAAGYGGEDWYRLTFVDRWKLSEGSDLEFAFNFWGRPDYLFTGIGLAGDPDNRTRYFQEFYDGQARVITRPWRGSELRVEVGLRSNRFADGAADEDEVRLTERFQGDQVPVGFNEGYTSSFQRMLLQIDTRLPRPDSGTGALIETYVTHGWDIDAPDQFEWMGYGGTLGGFLDIGHQRVIGLSGQAHLVNPVGDRQVPFTELFMLSRRPQDLSGFLPGTFIGRSAVVATLEYNYPIWVFIDGSLQLSVGNAFGENFEDFEPGALRSSIGLGLKSTQDRDNAFSILFAVGSTRFDEAFAVDAFRLVIGTQTGF